MAMFLFIFPKYALLPSKACISLDSELGIFLSFKTEMYYIFLNAKSDKQESSLLTLEPSGGL